MDNLKFLNFLIQQGQIKIYCPTTTPEDLVKKFQDAHPNIVKVQIDNIGKSTYKNRFNHKKRF